MYVLSTEKEPLIKTVPYNALRLMVAKIWYMFGLREGNMRKKRINEEKALLTQGGSVYDITVGTVVNIDIHSMMLFYLYTAGEAQKIRSKSKFNFFAANKNVFLLHKTF